MKVPSKIFPTKKHALKKLSSRLRYSDLKKREEIFKKVIPTFGTNSFEKCEHFAEI